jgi:hypothetical protein
VIGNGKVSSLPGEYRVCISPRVLDICYPGYYLDISSVVGEGVCKPCGVVRVGNEFFHDTAGGTVMNGESTCGQRCIDGYIPAQANTCQQCSEHWDVNENVFTACEAGFFLASTSSCSETKRCDTCTECVQGVSFESAPCGLSRNRECSMCRGCLSGFEYIESFCTVLSDTVCKYCHVCAAGTYTTGGCDGVNDFTCEVCPSGNWCPGGGILNTCPLNSMSDPGSTSLTDCICSGMSEYAGPVQCQPYTCGKREYGLLDGRCVSCPLRSGRRYFSTPVRGVETCVCEVGFFRNFTADESFFSCVPCSTGSCESGGEWRKVCRGDEESDSLCECYSEIPNGRLSGAPNCGVLCDSGSVATSSTNPVFDVQFRNERPRGGGRVMAEPQFPSAKDLLGGGVLFSETPSVVFACGVPLYASDNIRELRFWFTVWEDTRVFEARVDAQGDVAAQTVVIFGGTPAKNGVSFLQPGGISARWVVVGGTFQYFIADYGFDSNGRVLRLTPVNFGQSWNVFELVSAQSGFSVTYIMFNLQTTSLYFHAQPSNQVFKVNANTNAVNSFQALSAQTFSGISDLSVCGEAGLGHICVSTQEGGIFKYDGSAFSEVARQWFPTTPIKWVNGVLGGSLFIEYVFGGGAVPGGPGFNVPDIVVHDYDQLYSFTLGISTRSFGLGSVFSAPLPWDEPPEPPQLYNTRVRIFSWAVSTSESVFLALDTGNGNFVSFSLRSCPFASVWDGGEALRQPQCVPLPCAFRGSCGENEEPFGDLLECTCAAGFSRDSSGECVICAAGSYCPSGSNVGVSCGSVLSGGSVSVSGAQSESDCVCAAGAYVHTSPSGVLQCLQCPANSFCPLLLKRSGAGTGNLPCGSNRVSAAGAKSASACVCRSGWVLQKQSGSCVECSSLSLVCNVGGASVVTVTKFPCVFTMPAESANSFDFFIGFFSVAVDPTRRRTLLQAQPSAKGECYFSEVSFVSVFCETVWGILTSFCDRVHRTWGTGSCKKRAKFGFPTLPGCLQTLRT